MSHCSTEELRLYQRPAPILLELSISPGVGVENEMIHMSPGVFHTVATSHPAEETHFGCSDLSITMISDHR